MIIPEKTLKQVIDYCLKQLKDDYLENKTAGTETQSYIYKHLGDQTPVSNTDFDFYNNAVALLTRDSSHARCIETHFFLNTSRFNLPTIHITLSADNKGADGIGFDKNVDGPVFLTDTQFTDTGTRSFATRYQVVFTSDNTFEVILMYYLLRAALIGNSHLLSLNGIENPSIKGADIMLNDGLSPMGIYSRALFIDCMYSQTALAFTKQDITTDINVSGTPTPP